MRKIAVTFECDGMPMYSSTETILPEIRIKKCGSIAVRDVEILISGKGKMIIDDNDLPPGWSLHGDPSKKSSGYAYNKRDELEAGSKAYCPSCKADWTKT